ncbi:MAG TPA: hypothetical protein ENJ00_08510 [Phycisphaerales bacterium]|nr:hypothetical protein [Phycisphaerales bacterium]
MLGPESVVFDGDAWSGVDLVAVDRISAKEIVEYGDSGPQVIFADVVQSRVNVRVVLGLERSELLGPAPGDEGLFEFRAGFGRTDVGWVRVSMTAVVQRVTHELTPGGVKRVVQMVAVSSDGVTDPVTVEDVT